MHPILRHDRIKIYLAAWIPIAGLLAALAGPSRGRSWTESASLALPLALLCAFMCLGTWSVCRGLPLDRARFSRIAFAHGAAAAVSSALWVLLGLAWAAALGRILNDAGVVSRFESDALVFFAAGVLLFLLSAAVHYLLIAFETSREAERAGLELQVLAREAQLKTLTAQINPHFLFNSLNAIAALAGTEPEAARSMCQLLAEFFRATLSFGARASIRLEEDMLLVERFLAIEKARFGSRLSIVARMQPAAATCLVPPLLLQPLVENAVIHGIAHSLDGGIVRIEAHRDGDRLELRVDNPRDPDRPLRRGEGLGLANVRARLAALYGADARLEVLEGADTFSVTIRMPARADGETAKP